MFDNDRNLKPITYSRAYRSITLKYALELVEYYKTNNFPGRVKTIEVQVAEEILKNPFVLARKQGQSLSSVHK